MPITAWACQTILSSASYKWSCKSQRNYFEMLQIRSVEPPVSTKFIRIHLKNTDGSIVINSERFKTVKEENKTYYLCNQWHCHSLVNGVSAAYRNPIDLLRRGGSSSFLSFLLRCIFFLSFPLFFNIYILQMHGACIFSDLERISSASDDLLGQVSFLSFGSPLFLSWSLVLFVYTLGRVRYI